MSFCCSKQTIRLSCIRVRFSLVRALIAQNVPSTRIEPTWKLDRFAIISVVEIGLCRTENLTFSKIIWKIRYVPETPPTPNVVITHSYGNAIFLKKQLTSSEGRCLPGP